jgi:antirestriction protein
MSSIYVASLADYNAGRLHGAWIDIEYDNPPEDVWGQIEQMLQESPERSLCAWCGNKADGIHVGHDYMGGIVEEWEIHDFEDWPGKINPTHHSIEQLCAITQAIAEHGDAYLAWMANTGNTDPDDMSEYGTYSDAETLAMQYAESFINLDDLGFIQFHIDWESMGESLMSDGNYSTYEGVIYEWYQ